MKFSMIEIALSGCFCCWICALFIRGALAAYLNVKCRLFYSFAFFPFKHIDVLLNSRTLALYLTYEIHLPKDNVDIFFLCNLITISNYVCVCVFVCVRAFFLVSITIVEAKRHFISQSYFHRHR